MSDFLHKTGEILKFFPRLEANVSTVFTYEASMKVNLLDRTQVSLWNRLFQQVLLSFQFFFASCGDDLQLLSCVLNNIILKKK